VASGKASCHSCFHAAEECHFTSGMQQAFKEMLATTLKGHFVAPLLVVSGAAYSMGDRLVTDGICLSVWMSVVKLFRLLLLQLFSDFNKTWHT